MEISKKEKRNIFKLLKVNNKELGKHKTENKVNEKLMDNRLTLSLSNLQDKS